MAARNSLDLDSDPRSIIGTRVFDAPRELVFAAFTDKGRAQSVAKAVPAHWAVFIAQACNRSPLHDRLMKEV